MKKKAFFRLQTILNISDNRIFSLRKRIAKQKPWEPVIVSENLSWSDFSRINLFLHELEGVEPIVSVARTYPDNSSPCIDEVYKNEGSSSFCPTLSEICTITP